MLLVQISYFISAFQILLVPFLISCYFDVLAVAVTFDTVAASSSFAVTSDTVVVAVAFGMIFGCV